jgi:hypothetical protein
MGAANQIAKFWKTFEQRAAALVKIKSADDPVYEEILTQLQEVDDGLYFEFSARPGNFEFIVTAEGNEALFPLVERLIAAAPAMNGWTFFALKPKLGFPETVEWDGFVIRIDDVVFEPLSDDESGALGVRLLVPGLDEGDFDNAHNGLLRALDHGLGEREFAGAIKFTEVAALTGSRDEFIPLQDLEQYIRWRNKRRQS